MFLPAGADPVVSCPWRVHILGLHRLHFAQLCSASKQQLNKHMHHVVDTLSFCIKLLQLPKLLSDSSYQLSPLLTD